MAFPQTNLTITVELLLGGVWTDVSTYVRYASGIVIVRGRDDGSSTVDPGTCRLVFDNTDGRFSPRNPNGAWYGQIGRNSPLRVSVDPGSGAVRRFAGEVPSWPARWDTTGTDVYVPIVAHGILRRLAQGGNLRSALYTEIVASSPLAYWPLEEGVRADYAPSPLTNVAPMTGHIQFSVAAGPPGGGPAVSHSSLGSLRASIPEGSSSSWRVEAVVKYPDIGGTIDATSSAVEVLSDGGISIWRIGADPDPGRVFRVKYFPVGAGVGTDVDTSVTAFDGQWHHLRLDVEQNGAAIDVTLSVDGEVGATTTIAATTLGRLTQATIEAVEDATVGTLPTVGHITAWAPIPVSDPDTVAATMGFEGEAVVTRLSRLCAENTIPFTSVSGVSLDEVGPQRVAPLLELLHEAEAVDGGVLYEQRDTISDQPGLVYRPRTSKYTQTATLTLNYAAGDLAGTLEPEPDDQRARNAVTLSRRDGGTATYQQATGPLSVQLPPDGVGPYPTADTVNVYTDEQLLPLAQWLVHLGTWDEERYPVVTLDLARRTTLIDEAVTIDPGDVITLDNLPTWLPPDSVDLIVEGYTETLHQRHWTIAWNCTPGGPWNVGVLDDTEFGRLDTSGSELVAGITSGATSFEVAVTAGPLWTIDDTEFPFDVLVGGERMTVTDIAPPAALTFATGAAAHADNASVSPALPASTQSGDLLLILAAIRNSGTGVPNTPTGYTRLPVFPSDANAQLFAKIAGSSEVGPAVSFTGGAAGATTSARMARVRGGRWHNLGRVVHQAWHLLNASAQNIGYPGQFISEDNCLVLYLGWKQDDWTSVATLGGATELFDDSSTLGSDQGIVMDYVVQTTAAEIATASFTVTGGAAAISRGAVVAIHDDKQLWTVTRSVNGVVKAHSAAAAVELAQPFYLGL